MRDEAEFMGKFEPAMQKVNYAIQRRPEEASRWNDELELGIDMACKACNERGKTWPGDDPRCAFESGEFSDDNWNCATADLIRSICYEGKKLPSGVEYTYCDDMKFATVAVFHIEELAGSPMALWVAWYKNRGATDAMWLMFSDLPPRRPTEDECLLIAEAYSSNA